LEYNTDRRQERNREVRTNLVRPPSPGEFVSYETRALNGCYMNG